MTEQPEAPQPDPESVAMMIMLGGWAAGMLPTLMVGLAADHFLPTRAFWFLMAAFSAACTGGIQLLRNSGWVGSPAWAHSQFGIVLALIVLLRVHHGN